MKNHSIFFVILLFSINIYSKTIVTYPNIHGLGTDSFGYDVLKLALSKINNDYEVKLAYIPVNAQRAEESLENEAVSVIDGGISSNVANKFDIIYKPIDMGLLGWRLFIINKIYESDFAKIKTLKQLKKMKAGQGQSWSDIDILENSEIAVVTAPHLDSLLKMVEKGRFNFLPLGVNEVYGLLNNFAPNNKILTVEKTLVLVYPFGRFFYVKKGNKKLYDDISHGLDIAFEDRSFQKLIFNHPFFKEGLEKANLKNRTIIKINNPYMPNEFWDINPKWWYKIK